MAKSSKLLYWKEALVNRFGQLSLVWKFMLINAFIFVLVLALMLVINIHLTNTIKQEITDSNERYLNYISQIIQTSLENVSNLHYQFYTNNDLDYLKSQREYDGECIVRMLRIKSTLSVFNLVTPISSNVSLYFEQLNMVISPQGTCRGGENFRDTVWDHINSGDSFYLYKGYIGLNRGESAYIMSQSYKYGEEQHYFIFDLSKDGYGMALFITINTDELSNLIQNANYNERNIFLMLDENMNYIAGDVRNISSSLSDTENVAFQVESYFNNEKDIEYKHIITEKTDDFRQIKYITLYPYTEIMNRVAAQSRAFIFFYGALIMLELLFMAIYYFVFIMPVKNLYNKIAVNDNKSNEIRVLDSVFTDLNMQINMNRLKIDIQNDMIFELWLQKVARKMIPLDDIMANTEYINRIKGFCVIHVVVHEDSASPNCLNHIIKVVNDHFDIYTLSINPQKMTTLLVCCNDKSGYSNVCESIQHAVHDHSATSLFFIGISSFITKIQLLAEAITESTDALLYSSQVPVEHVIVYNKKDLICNSFSIDMNDESRLMNVILSGDTEHQLDSLLKRLFDLGNTIAYYRQIAVYLIFIRNTIMNNVDVQIGELLQAVGNIKEIPVEDFYTKEDIKAYLSLQLKVLAEMASGSKRFPYNEIIEFVHLNYDKVISLDVVADQFNLSTAYLSRYFKKATGENFVVYINRLRISEAKELLEESDMILKDISDKVGFSDQKYFIKVFKQYEGITPGKYRDLCKKNI